MKKSVLLMFAVLAMVLSGCSSDDDDNFNYPMSSLHGTWKGTSVKVKGNWVDITKFPYTEFGFSISFYQDGTYYGKGYFGDGDGTYKTKKNIIYTYIDGEEYARYDIKSLSGNKAELTMTMDGESMDVKVEKK